MNRLSTLFATAMLAGMLMLVACEPIDEEELEQMEEEMQEQQDANQ